jgi:hypothetical protein
MAEDFLAQVGVHAKDLVAGFSGGFAGALIDRRHAPWIVISSTVVGGLAANYLTAPFSSAFGLTEPTSGFIVGLIGMKVCRAIVASAGSWSPFKGRSE